MNIRFSHSFSYALTIVCIVLACLIFIAPQVWQQFVQNQLPITGDLVHSRIVYFLTNFPNFVDAPALTLSHSQLYHQLVAALNIESGMVDELSFFGVTLLNMVLLLLAALTIFMIAYRFQSRWAFFAPLIFLGNPNLVLPFFGHANQHFIFLFFALTLFVLLFLRANFGTRVLAMFLLGITLNSSLAIWFPLVLAVLVFELLRPSYRAPLLLGVAALLYLPFLTVPVGYLAFGDFTGTLASLPRLAAVIAVGLITLLVYYQLLRSRPRLRQWLLVVAGSVATILFFSLARTGGPFSGNVSPEDYIEAKNAYQSSIHIIDYLFSINQNKDIVGYSIYVSVVVLVLGFGGLAAWRARRIKSEELSIRPILPFVVIPPVLALVTLALLRVFFDYFSRSPLWNLHVARIMSMALFLLPVVWVRCFAYLQRTWNRWMLASLTLALIANCVFISVFAAQRMHADWTQRTYQRALQTSLEQGIGNSLSGAETLYACHFYAQCDLQPAAEVEF